MDLRYGRINNTLYWIGGGVKTRGMEGSKMTPRLFSNQDGEDRRKRIKESGCLYWICLFQTPTELLVEDVNKKFLESGIQGRDQKLRKYVGYMSKSHIGL